tara:strand:+ start:9106 stop:10146 length:1041 start_codon:yes stop_codon:yes gene_type:complete
MPKMVDIFNDDAFSVVAVTESINDYPVQYGRVTQMGIFKDESIDTTAVAVEINKGVLSLIQSKKRGGDRNKNKRDRRKLRHFGVPHFPLDDRLLPSDIQNARQFGSATEMKTPETEVARILESMSKKHDITGEFLKMGALKGKVYDPSGEVILDIFAEFGVEQKVINMALNTDSTNVIKKIGEIKDHIDENMGGDTYDYIHCLCSADFFNALIDHPKIREIYVHQQVTKDANPLITDMSESFIYQNIVFEKYNGKANVLNEDGTESVIKFIDDGDAHFFPVGTSETFRNYNAPADYMETVNTPGLPKYAKAIPDTGDRFVDIESESNPLPLCLRPAILVKGTVSAS